MVRDTHPAPGFVMLSKAKHPAVEWEVRSAPEAIPHAMPGSFAALRMTNVCDPTSQKRVHNYEVGVVSQ